MLSNLQESLEAGCPLSPARGSDPAGVRGGRGQDRQAAAGAGQGTPDLRGHRAKQRGRWAPTPGLQDTHGVRQILYLTFAVGGFKIWTWYYSYELHK